MKSWLVMALSLPPCRATIFENSPGGIRSVPLNIRCSRKCGRPDLPIGLSAVPTRYQSQCATTGARRFGTTTTSSPLSSVKLSGLNREAGISSGAISVGLRVMDAGVARNSLSYGSRPQGAGRGVLPVRAVTTLPVPDRSRAASAEGFSTSSCGSNCFCWKFRM